MRDFHLPGRSAVFATGAMCATSHPLAAKTALDILAGGGNAVDAAIAAAVLLGIAEPQATGIGGDAFALIRTPGGERIGLNASGRAPQDLDVDALRAAGPDIPARSVHAVTIPGAVDGFCRLSADHGRLPLADLLAPAINHAQAGVPAGPRTAVDWAAHEATLCGAGRRHYLAGDAPLAPGALFRAPGQAEVLRRVAAEGRAGFYSGDVARDMVDSLRALGGSHTAEDFAAVEARYVDPIHTDYRGARLWELPPNGQGATALLLANILAQFDLAALDPFGAERAHLETEATKLAYDARDRFLADADHVTRLAHMRAPETAQRLAGLIRPDAVIDAPARAAGAVHKDTVYLTVVDADRMAVSLIYSIYHAFGSGLASDRFGILFQNRGAGFTLEPGHPNEAGPGKRPMHTIIPALLEMPDGRAMPFGVMGGAYQATGHARILGNIVDHGMDPQAALDGPRAFWEDGALRVERGYPDAVRQRYPISATRSRSPTRPSAAGRRS